MSHTPSPWFIADDGRFVYALNDRGVNSFSAHVMDSHTSDEELRDTARLIAAAPDMLEALLAVQFTMPDCQVVNEAIAKAKGESHDK